MNIRLVLVSLSCLLKLSPLAEKAVCSNVYYRSLNIYLHLLGITLLFIFGYVGTGPIFDAPSCTGSESRLIDCSQHSRINFITRTHYLDAAVRCQPANQGNFYFLKSNFQINLMRWKWIFIYAASVACNHGDARLVGGSSSNEGRIELCYEGVWGSVCTFYLDNRFTAVLCRQLGFYGTSK